MEVDERPHGVERVVVHRLPVPVELEAVGGRHLVVAELAHPGQRVAVERAQIGLRGERLGHGGHRVRPPLDGPSRRAGRRTRRAAGSRRARSCRRGCRGRPSACAPCCANVRPRWVLPMPVAPYTTVTVPGRSPPPSIWSSCAMPLETRCVMKSDCTAQLDTFSRAGHRLGACQAGWSGTLPAPGSTFGSRRCRRRPRPPSLPAARVRRARPRRGRGPAGRNPAGARRSTGREPRAGGGHPHRRADRRRRARGERRVLRVLAHHHPRVRPGADPPKRLGARARHPARQRKRRTSSRSSTASGCASPPSGTPTRCWK